MLGAISLVDEVMHSYLLDQMPQKQVLYYQSLKLMHLLQIVNLNLTQTIPRQLKQKLKDILKLHVNTDTTTDSK